MTPADPTTPALPPDFDPHRAQVLCIHIANGQDLVEAARAAKVALVQVRRWRRQVPWFHEQMVVADELRAETAVEQAYQRIQALRRQHAEGTGSWNSETEFTNALRLAKLDFDAAMSLQKRADANRGRQSAFTAEQVEQSNAQVQRHMETASIDDLKTLAKDQVVELEEITALERMAALAHDDGLIPTPRPARPRKKAAAKKKKAAKKPAAAAKNRSPRKKP